MLGQTEDDCEDPDRIVVFDDVSEALFFVSSPSNRVRFTSTAFNKIAIFLATPIYVYF